MQVQERSWAVEQRMKLRLEDLLSHDTVTKWYYSRKESGRKSGIYHLLAFINWREKKGLSANPDLWISDCKHGNNLTLENHLDILKEWVEGESFDGSDVDTRKKYYTDVRGFYLKNRVTLPQEPLTLKLRSNSDTEIRAEAYEVTAKRFLEMSGEVVRSKIGIRDRSIIMTTLQGGIDASTLAKSYNYIAFPQLVQHFGTADFSKWDESKVPVRIDIIRPKTNYRFYTGQGRDAIACLKTYLSRRVSEFGEIKIYPPRRPDLLPTSDPIFLNKLGKPIESWTVSEIFRECGKEAGQNVKPMEKLAPYKGARRRYPFHSHECRDTLITIARRAGVELAVANFFCGHDIDGYKYDKDPYDSPELFMQQYAKLLPYVELISGRERAIRSEVEEALKYEMTSSQKEYIVAIGEWIGQFAEKMTEIPEAVDKIPGLNQETKQKLKIAYKGISEMGNNVGKLKDALSAFKEGHLSNLRTTN